MRLKNNRQGTAKSAAHFSLMTILREKDITLRLRTARILIRYPESGIKTIKHPIDKLAVTQIRIETQIQTDSLIKTDQATLGTTDQKTVSKLSITSVLDQRTQILNKTKTVQRTTVYLHPTQFNSSTTTDNM